MGEDRSQGINLAGARTNLTTRPRRARSWPTCLKRGHHADEVMQLIASTPRNGPSPAARCAKPNTVISKLAARLGVVFAEPLALRFSCLPTARGTQQLLRTEAGPSDWRQGRHRHNPRYQSPIDVPVGPVGDEAGDLLRQPPQPRSNATTAPAATVTAAAPVRGKGRTAGPRRRKELRPGPRELSNQTRPDVRRR